MTKADLLRSKFTNWKSSPGPETVNDLMSACIVSIRATVRSVLIRRDDLWDAAESDAIDQVWSKLGTRSGDIAAFVRLIARSRAIDLLRSVTTRSKVDQLDDLSHIPDEHESLELIDLTPEQQTIARMLAKGESERSVMETLGISRRKLKTAMAAIAELYKNHEN